MRFYTEQHQHYCGIDLHTRTLYLCIRNARGNVLLHKNLPCDRDRFLEAVAPFRQDLVVASSPWPTPILQRCDPPGTCSAAVPISSASGPSSWPTSRTPFISTICPGPRGASSTSTSKYQREPIPDAFDDPMLKKSVETDLALTLLYEIRDIGRFDSVQRFASYARLVKCEKSSAGKRLGISGHKLGRTVYFMLKRNQAFDAHRFLANA